jgi:glycosyltransferase involved in cell wall biosynthesis
MTRVTRLSQIMVNTRTLSGKTTGVQRYTRSILDQNAFACETISPAPDMALGLKGHIWEQVILPNSARGKLLWSPANTGPVLARNQVVTIHDASPLDHPEWFTRQFAKVYQAILPCVARTAKVVITDSEFSRSRLLQHIPGIDAKINVVLLGVDARFRPVSPAETAQIRARYNLERDFVLFLGSIEPRKNLRNVLLAWAQVSQHFPNIDLVVAGAGGNAFRSVELEPLPARVHFMGHFADQDLPALYGAAMAFVYPSFYEGFGLPPLEAMASGVPVIVSTALALREVVGDAGIFVDPHQPDQIATALKRLLEDGDLRRDLRVQGLVRAGLFTWERTAQQTARILEAALP